MSSIGDTSVGVEDFSDWSYFRRRRPKAVIIGHSSSFSETVLQKSKHHKAYDMTPHSMLKKAPKTKLELKEEVIEQSERARIQLARWKASDPNKGKGKGPGLGLGKELGRSRDK